MKHLIMGSLLVAGYLLVFWILGAAMPKKFQTKKIPVMCITGFLFYYTSLQIVAFPMKYMRCSMKQLTVVWGILMIIIMVFVIWKQRAVLTESIKELAQSREKKYLTVLAVMTLFLALLLGFNINTLSIYDSNNYIGLPVASVYSNTLERMDPFSGTMLDMPKEFYLMNTDTLQSAMVYQALKVHPLIERKWSFTIVMVILFEMALYQCADSLFKKRGKEKNGAEKTVFVFLANLVLLFSYSIAGASHYFAYRAYEGKAIICYFYMTVIFAFCLAIYHKEKKLWPWMGLFLCGAGGIAFSNSALFIVPGMIGCTLFPHVLGEGIRKKQWKIVGRYMIVLLQSAFWMVISYLI